MKTKYGSEINSLSTHYDKLALRFGYSHNAVQQSSFETQARRLEILLEGFPDLSGKKILDFGCGIGFLYELLKTRFTSVEYLGIDISEQQILLAKNNHPEARFDVINIFEEKLKENFDVVFISGVFNNLINDNIAFMQDVLEILFPLCREGLAFNCLSTYVDYKSPDLFYFDPSKVFSYCKEKLTPQVTLRHDYEIKAGTVPFEFTCYLKSSKHEIRQRNDN